MLMSCGRSVSVSLCIGHLSHTTESALSHNTRMPASTKKMLMSGCIAWKINVTTTARLHMSYLCLKDPTNIHHKRKQLLELCDLPCMKTSA